MARHYSRLAVFTLLVGLLFVPVAHADTRIDLQIGAPVVAAVPIAHGPYPGYIWQPGYYVWTGHHYRWVPGTWVPAPHANRHWERERWARDRYWDRYDRRYWDDARPGRR